NRFAPFAVKQRGNRRGSGDAVQQKLAESKPLLEGEFFLAIHFIGASLDIGARPDPALGPTGMMVDAKDSGVEIGQRVEVDQAGADQRISEIDAASYFAGKIMPDEQDFTLLENDFAIAEKPVATVLVPDHPACGDQGAAFRPRSKRKGFQCLVHHGISATATPGRAVTRPPLTTSGRGAISTTAWARVSPVRRVKSALQPTFSP